MTALEITRTKIVLIGGNGFVGCNIAKRLVDRDIETICISRSGKKPAHLEPAFWADKVRWHKSDAKNLDTEILSGAQALVCLVGSPPVPTLSGSAYKKQLFMNSAPNISAIEAAADAGVKRVVLLGAHLPSILNTDKFAYAKGKKLCLEAAKYFSTLSESHSAIVLQPTAIYGTRYLPSGKPINIGALMQPMSKVQGMIPKPLRGRLPEQFVSVDAVSETAVSACLDSVYDGIFTIISNQQILLQESV